MIPASSVTHDIRPIRALLWVCWPMRGLVVTRDGGQRLIVWLQRLSRVMTGCAWVMTSKWSCQGVSSSILRVTVTSCVCCVMLSCSQIRGNWGKQGIMSSCAQSGISREHSEAYTQISHNFTMLRRGQCPRCVATSGSWIMRLYCHCHHQRLLSRTLITDNMRH